MFGRNCARALCPAILMRAAQTTAHQRWEEFILPTFSHRVGRVFERHSAMPVGGKPTAKLRIGVPPLTEAIFGGVLDPVGQRGSVDFSGDGMV